jgi:hypothetical protein
MSRGCVPGGSITADWWFQVSDEMSDDQVDQEFQIISITVSWGVEDLLRLYPDWTTEEAEHFIDSSYREISAEAREAGDRMIHKIVEEIERGDRGASN